MKLITFSIFDEKAKAYIPPFFMHREGQAARVFSDCIRDEKHQFSKNPGDYTLYIIGTFDDETGTITNDGRELMGNGLSYLSLTSEPDNENEQIRDDPSVPPSPKS